MVKPPADHEPIQYASLDEIEALQLARLRDVLPRVYGQTAHYRAAFDAIGFQPGDVKSIADIAHLPFTTKSDLHSN